MCVRRWFSRQPEHHPPYEDLLKNAIFSRYYFTLHDTAQRLRVSRSGWGCQGKRSSSPTEICFDVWGGVVHLSDSESSRISCIRTPAFKNLVKMGFVLERQWRTWLMLHFEWTLSLQTYSGNRSRVYLKLEQKVYLNLDLWCSCQDSWCLISWRAICLVFCDNMQFFSVCLFMDGFPWPLTSSAWPLLSYCD